jgi:hypothetical protein
LKSVDFPTFGIPTKATIFPIIFQLQILVLVNDESQYAIFAEWFVNYRVQEIS